MSKHDGSSASSRKRVTALSLRKMKENGEKIATLTCYDAAFARLMEDSTIDVVLVGDSLGNVMLGFDSTIPVTMDHMVHHTAAVARRIKHAFLVADMPFMSYNMSPEQALTNAARLLQEAGAHAVKLEGGEEIIPQIEALVHAGIPVMGHLGLTPQKIHSLGGFRVQGRGEQGDKLFAAAKRLEAAGICSLVLELVPKDLTRRVSEALQIPTIGIGAGPYADGQVLVLHDLLGFDEGFRPKFLKTYANLHETVTGAIRDYVHDVKSANYPTDEHSFD
ncbi:MAG: 3-methyl-2-oxobutanoate hydroxymethyltransferase [Oligoflexus sp.]